MDRAEKIGLGTAVGGHMLLFGALSLGLLMSTDRIKKPEALSVSLVGEISAVSTAPDAIQEEPAPAAAGDTETFDPPAATPIERPVPKVVERPVTPPAKTAVKQVTPKQVQPKQQTRPNPSRNPPAAKSGGFSKSFEDAVNSAGKTAGSGTKAGSPHQKAPPKSAAR